jgi:hypothetical protein
VTVTVHNPPTTGPNTTKNSAVEVIIQQTATPVLASMFVSGMAVRNRAVALLGNGLNVCVLARGVGTQTGKSLLLTGGGTITAPNCVLSSNATDVEAVLLNGSAHITAGSIISQGRLLR